MKTPAIPQQLRERGQGVYHRITSHDGIGVPVYYYKDFVFREDGTFEATYNCPELAWNPKYGHGKRFLFEPDLRFYLYWKVKEELHGG